MEQKLVVLIVEDEQVISDGLVYLLQTKVLIRLFVGILTPRSPRLKQKLLTWPCLISTCRVVQAISLRG